MHFSILFHHPLTLSNILEIGNQVLYVHLRAQRQCYPNIDTLRTEFDSGTVGIISIVIGSGKVDQPCSTPIMSVVRITDLPVTFVVGGNSLSPVR